MRLRSSATFQRVRARVASPTGRLSHTTSARADGARESSVERLWRTTRWCLREYKVCYFLDLLNYPQCRRVVWFGWIFIYLYILLFFFCTLFPVYAYYAASRFEYRARPERDRRDWFSRRSTLKRAFSCFLRPRGDWTRRLRFSVCVARGSLVGYMYCPIAKNSSYPQQFCR